MLVFSFQFHYGTIKSVHGNVSTYQARFQFHYGTIKRCVPVGVPLAVLAFNSTMVRLKAVSEVVPVNVVRFQFHYGTIKSRVAGVA